MKKRRKASIYVGFFLFYPVISLSFANVKEADYRGTKQSFSYFDTGKRSSAEEPECFHAVKATTKTSDERKLSVCFYHGFVLGLMVELTDRYVITSNRESSFGRYDIMMEPRSRENSAVITGI